MRRYFTEFVQLPFLVERANHALKKSIDLVQRLDNHEITKLPSDIDMRFMTVYWL